MEQDMEKITWLTLDEIERVCNEYVQRFCPKESIRSKYRFLREPLICRYIYYIIAREQMKPARKVVYESKAHDGSIKKRQHTTLPEHAHTLTSIGKRIGFKHATVIHGLSALETLITSKNKIAIDSYAEIADACEKLLLTKKDINDLDKTTKRLLAGAV